MSINIDNFLKELKMLNVNQISSLENKIQEQIKLLKKEFVSIKREVDPKLNQIEKYKRLIGTLENYLRISQSKDINFLINAQEKKKSIGDMAVEILKQKREPQHYTFIMKKIEWEYNFEIPGKNPKANMIAHLLNEARIKKFNRGYYGLKEWAKENFRTVHRP